VENDIYHISYPAYTSTILDPLDVSVYQPVKTAMRHLKTQIFAVHRNGTFILDSTGRARQHKLTESRCLQGIDRCMGFENSSNYRNMVLMVEFVMRVHVNHLTIQDGWARSGIFPFNPDVVLRHAKDYIPPSPPSPKMTRSRDPLTLTQTLDTIKKLADDFSLTEVERIRAIRGLLETAQTPRRVLGLYPDQQQLKDAPKVPRRRARRTALFKDVVNLEEYEGALQIDEEGRKGKGKRKAASPEPLSLSRDGDSVEEEGEAAAAE
jgi:hypothetical protein